MKLTGLSLVELPSGRSWDPRIGFTIIRRYRGSLTQIQIVEADAKANNLRVQIEPDIEGGFGVVSVWYGAESTQPAGVPLADTWELVGNDLEKDLWELPKIVAALAPFNISDRRQIKIDIEAWLAGTLVVNDLPVRDWTDYCTRSGFTTDQVEILTQLVTERIRGVQAWTVSQWVLRRTLIIAANSTIKPALADVGRVRSTTTLKAEENIPSTVKFDLPEGFWLKRTPTFTQTAADKWTISQEWWHADNYSELLYGKPV
jgi:hypothetical protein